MRVGPRSAFTLVELLVVIGVIAILAGILVPVFVRARFSAKETASLTQLSQIGKAIHIYSSDHDDRVPYAVGNSCFMLAVTRQKDCGLSIDPQVAAEAGPINSLLSPYGAPPLLFKSSIDRMSNVLLQEPGHKETWYEETTTPLHPGSSFEYNNLIGLRSMPMSGAAQVSQTALMYSLYLIDEGYSNRRQVLFMDGHSGETPSNRLHLSYD